MPIDDLPMYPTPQQAAYVVGNSQSSHSNKKSGHPKSSSSGYRPSGHVKAAPGAYGQAPMALHSQNSHGYVPQHHSLSRQVSLVPSQHMHQPPPQSYQPTQNYYQAPAGQHMPSGGYARPVEPSQMNYGPPQAPSQPPQQYYVQPHPQQPPIQHPHPVNASHQYVQQPPQMPMQQPLAPAHSGDSRQYSQNSSYQPYKAEGPVYLSPSYPAPSNPKTLHKKPPPVQALHPQSSTPPRPTESTSTLRIASSSKESLSGKNNTSPKLTTSKHKLEGELRSVFNKVDANQTGRITHKELSHALLNFDHTRFQESTIRLMIKLFSNSTGAQKSLNFEQFVSLWKYLSAYKKLFLAADSNKSGDISFGEFQNILEQIGYKLNIDLVLHLFQKFSHKNPDDAVDSIGAVGKLKFDSFIELLVYLRKLTDIFKKYDKDLSGVATINFLDFLLEISNIS